jgi:diguanylate cyclase (GGDEF)-like protein
VIGADTQMSSYSGSTGRRDSAGDPDASALATSALLSREALESYARLLRGVLDDLPVAVLVIEPPGRLVLSNDELARLVPQAAGAAAQRDLEGVLLAIQRIVVKPEEFDRALQAALADDGDPQQLEATLHDGGAISVGVTSLSSADNSRVVWLRDASGELHTRRALEHRALHDPLTGLPNRELLLDRLAVALARRVRQETAIGVIFVDLDGFKEVNDQFGHVVGDDVLVSVAQRLQREVRDGDTVARFGGDEFVVLCEDLANDQIAAPLARRLAEAIAKPVTAGGRLLEVRASVGVVIERDPSIEPEALIARADAAMYTEKHRGGRRASSDRRI